MSKSRLYFIIFLLLLLLAACIYFLVNANTITAEIKQDKERATIWQDAWDNGESTQGLAVLVGKENRRDNVELRYTVDEQDYTVICSMTKKGFNAIDGEDKDGQGEVEIHYKADDPQIATCETALKIAKQVRKTYTYYGIFLGLIAVAMLYQIFFGNRAKKRR